MLFRNYYARLRGKFCHTLATHCACRPLQVKLPRAIVSFTFDDFPASALHAGAPILEQYGVAGTYYVSLGLADKDGPVGRYFSESDLPQLLARGHELGCHTFDHRHAWLTPSKEYEQSVIRNRERLQRILPGVDFLSHSYPISYPRPTTKTIASRYFTCARGGGQKPNEQRTDGNHLAAFFIEKSRDNLAAIKAQIDQAKTTSSWLILATHDICNTPSPFGCRPELFAAIVRHAIEVGVTVLPVSRAIAQLRPGSSQ